MWTIERADEAAFEDILPLLQEFGDGTLTSAEWRRLVEHSWSAAVGEPTGYLLCRGSQVEGFLGTIYSRRTIDGSERLFCNLSSWIVRGQHDPGLRVPGWRLILAISRPE